MHYRVTARCSAKEGYLVLALLFVGIAVVSEDDVLRNEGVGLDSRFTLKCLSLFISF